MDLHIENNIPKIRNITEKWKIKTTISCDKELDLKIIKPVNCGTNIKTIILVHGYMCNDTFWDIKDCSFAGYLVHHDFRVIIVNLSHETICEMIAHIKKIMKKLDLNNIILLGHSLGGVVVSAVAGCSKLRKRIDKIIVICSPVDLTHSLNNNYVHYYADKILRPFVDYFHDIKKLKIPTNYVTPYIKNVPCIIHKFIPIELYSKNSMDTNILSRVIKYSVDPMYINTLCDLLDVPNSVLKQINKFEQNDVPLLVITSKNDKIINYKDALNIYNKKKYNRNMLLFGENSFGHMDIMVGKDAMHDVWAPIVDYCNS